MGDVRRVPTIAAEWRSSSPKCMICPECYGLVVNLGHMEPGRWADNRRPDYNGIWCDCERFRSREECLSIVDVANNPVLRCEFFEKWGQEPSVTE
jgi:hypothetical protein